MILHSIPTTYRGVNFRSRLEAKYAALFDQLGWHWDYEPIDLKGWIPDFAIRGIKKPILVEVKPIFVFDEVLGTEIAVAVGHDMGGNDRCYEAVNFETLICGAVLPKNEFGDLGPGWLWDGYWSPAHVYELNGAPRKATSYGLCHDTNSYRDRITGIYEGNGQMGPVPDLQAMWIRAGNLVQWRRAS